MKTPTLRTATLLAAAAGLAAVATAPATADPDPDPWTGALAGTALFDDFHYTGNGDGKITQHGWTLKSGTGAPGAPGITWDPDNVSFTPAGTGEMTLRTTTDGTATGTRQAEIYHQRKYRNGTYAARVRFSNAPVSGPDGDQMVQTFFSVSPLVRPMDPDYSELDFEYLPNGGWGEPNSILHATSWETYQPDPWVMENTYNVSRASYAGWHDLMITVDNKNIKYYVDGKLFATHGEPYLPESDMSINLNQWIIPGGLVADRTPRAYDEKVDYVYYAKDEVLTPRQVRQRVAAYRMSGTDFQDTVPAP